MNEIITLKEKRIKKIQGKSVESLFRTLSKNNYRLQQMVDRKANILVSINTIILTIILSSKYSELEIANFVKPLYILFAASLLSLIFALMSVRPFVVNMKSLGMKGNNLVNIATINHTSISEYKSKMNKVLGDDNAVYDAMTEDIFFIGKNIQRKHQLLQMSAALFLIGLVLTSGCLLLF